MRIYAYFLLSVFFAGELHGQQSGSISEAVKKYVRVSGPRIVLKHVRVIDGTGKPAVEDQNITIEKGKIVSIKTGADIEPSAGTTILDLRGYSVMPGIVGMHDHLFYLALPDLDSAYASEPPILLPQMSFSAPRLYLAAGVTTLRTTGSVEPYTDLSLKRDIDNGKLPGPHLDVTGPYAEGADSWSVQMHELTGPDEAREFVNYWADRGVTSFKAYTKITRAELGATIQEAHKRGIKVTGHLCSVTYPEAAELGIDNLEHGFFYNTQSDPDKKPDHCPGFGGGSYTIQHMEAGSPEAKALFDILIKHHVAITSTLAVFEGRIPGRPALRQAVLDAMSPQARESYLYARVNPEPAPTGLDWNVIHKHELQMEHAFSLAGGLLLAGCDPTGDGGVLPGFGDQREVELLTEAGFSPVDAIKIATWNGAVYMGKHDQIGSIAVGKNADLVVIKGDPSTRITDIENVEIVFKDGVGYDSQKLLESVRGHYGQY